MAHALLCSLRLCCILTTHLHHVAVAVCLNIHHVVSLFLTGIVNVRACTLLLRGSSDTLAVCAFISRFRRQRCASLNSHFNRDNIE